MIYSDVKSLSLARTENVPTLRSTGLAMDSLSSPAFFRFPKDKSFSVSCNMAPFTDTYADCCIVKETHEKYFYGTEHWNYFTNDEVGASDY